MNRLLERRGFRLLPLQTPGTTERLGVTADALLARMHLLTADGRRFAGADAFVEIARHFRWAWPFVAVTRLPLVLPLLRRGYDWIAANRYCLGRTCRVPRQPGIAARLPLLLLPLLVFIIRQYVTDWILTWAMAFGLYGGCKWLTYRKATNVMFTYLVIVYGFAAWKGGWL
jgi:predicted DCC family thiol-disulfide oxidoreductase YuxK